MEGSWTGESLDWRKRGLERVLIGGCVVWREYLIGGSVDWRRCGMEVCGLKGAWC